MNIKTLIHKILPAEPKKAFYLMVKCVDCGEEIRVRINRSSDFQKEYNKSNPEHRYTIKKEVVGKNCFNLMKITLALTKEGRVLFADTKGCGFIKFDRE